MKVYISHSIRGKAGKYATPTQMKDNCDAIIAIATKLRQTIPIAEFYVPAESEPFVQRAYDSGYIDEAEILNVDCKIIKDLCDAVIVHIPDGDELQGGRLVEWQFAIDNNIPVFIFRDVGEAISYVADTILRS